MIIILMSNPKEIIPNRDAIDAVATLYDQYNDERTVSKRFGISVTLVKKYVKFSRLPKLIQDNL